MLLLFSVDLFIMYYQVFTVRPVICRIKSLY